MLLLELFIVQHIWEKIFINIKKREAKRERLHKAIFHFLFYIFVYTQQHPRQRWQKVLGGRSQKHEQKHESDEQAEAFFYIFSACLKY